MNALALIRLILLNKRLIFLFAGVSAFCAFLVGLFVVSYQAEGQLFIRPIGTKSVEVDEWLAPGVISSLYPNNISLGGITYISVLRSREIVGRVVDQLDLQKRYEAPYSVIVDALKQPLRLLFYGRIPAVRKTPREQAMEELILSIKVILISGSSVLQISAKDNNATRVSDIVNTLMDTAVAYSAEHSARKAMRVTQLLEVELKRIGKQRTESVEKLAGLRTAYGIKSTATIEQQITDLSQRIIAIETLMEERLSNHEVEKHMVDDLRERIAQMPEHSLGSYTIDKASKLQNLWQTLLGQKMALIEALVDFQVNSPQITSRKDQIALTEQAIDDVLEKPMPAETFLVDKNREQLTTNLINSEISIANFQIEIDAMQDRIGRLSKHISQLNAIYEEFNLPEKTIDTLKGAETKIQIALEKARAMTSVSLSEFEILNRAVTPRHPSINKIPLAFYVFFAAFMGGFIALFYILGRENRAQGEGN